MLNNFIVEQKEKFKDYITAQYNYFMNQIDIRIDVTDYKSVGIAYGAVSYAAPPLMLLPAAALIVQAANTQPFIIGSVIGFISAPFMIGVASGVLPVLGSGLGSLTGQLLNNGAKFAGSLKFFAAAG